MKEPKRPANVPADAFWNSEEKEWQRGPKSNHKKPHPIGRWEYWRADGTLCCIANMDDEGRLEGMCERFHEDGTLAWGGPYKAGHRHGHFVHIQSKNPTSEHYPANKRTWRHEFDSNANWEEHNLRWFLEDGTECTSSGKPLSQAYDLDEVILNADPEEYLDRFAEDVKQAILAGEPEDEEDDYYDDEPEEIDLSQFEELWGIKPDRVLKFMHNLHQTDSFTIRGSQRTFEPEDNVWHKLISYPWENTFEEFAAVFMGALQIGRMGDSDGVYTTLFRSQFETPLPDIVYEWSHETYYIDDVQALSQDDFAFRTAISKAHETERLSPKATRKSWKKLAGRIYVGWGAASGLDLLSSGDADDDADEDEDDGEVPDFNTDIDPKHKARSTYWRSQWIQHLLQSDEERDMNLVAEVFRPDYNKPISDEQHEKDVEGAFRLPNNACYILWRYFWFKQEKRLQDFMEVFRDHPARIVRDLVKLIDDINAGKTEIGNIKNILEVREEFLKLDLCPEYKDQRDEKAAVKAEADTKLQDSVRADAEKAFGQGEELVLDLAWSHASDSLCIDEVEKLARKLPGNETYWRAFDWICQRGYTRAESEQADEAEGVAIWLGEQGSKSRVIQPFAWALLFKGNYPAAAATLRGIACTPLALDPRVEPVLLRQLKQAEEYNHKRELAVHLLGCMKANHRIPELNALLSEIIETLSRFSRDELRNESFAYESLLGELTRTLGKLEPANEPERVAICNNLRKLYTIAMICYRYDLASHVVESLVKLGDYNLLRLLEGLRVGNDDPERWAMLRTLEEIASKLSKEELDSLAEYFPNPCDHDNGITILYNRTLHALAAADRGKKRFKTLPMAEVLMDAEELSNYGDDNWRQYRIIICETVAKFAELDLDLIKPFLYSAKRDLRMAAEAAYKARGVEAPRRRVISWADVWNIVDNSGDREKAAAEIGKLIADPGTVERNALAGWLWENPSAAAAAGLAEAANRALDTYSPPGSGEYLSPEFTWILRAVAKHAEYPEIAQVLDRCFKTSDAEITGAIIQDCESLPLSYAETLVRIASEDTGWRRYYIARWAAKHQKDQTMAKVLKENKITEKKLAAWAR